MLNASRFPGDGVLETETNSCEQVEKAEDPWVRKAVFEEGEEPETFMSLPQLLWMR
jgi:hypothetical protein